MKKKPQRLTPKSTTPTPSGELPSRMTARDYREKVLGELPQFGGTPEAEPEKKAQIRLAKAQAMNANERRLLAVLEKRHQVSAIPGCRILYEPMSFRLPSGTLYTPDFVVLTEAGTILAIYEAKDSYLNKSSAASKAKFKEARIAFPQFRWVFAQWDKATGKYLEAE